MHAEQKPVPTPQTLEEQILWDLQKKVSDDVAAAIDRVIRIAPEAGTIAVQAATTALSVVVAVMAQDKMLGKLHDENLKILAALTVGRVAVVGELHLAHNEAIKDMAALADGKRVK